MIGRRPELAALRQRLSGDSRLVTLTGPGGIGKSCLARAAASDLERSFEDGAVVVDLDEVAEPALLGAAVSRALGLHLQGDQWELGHLTGVLGDQEVLLVLDGCDRLLDACAELVAGLLAACRRMRVLATGRQPLRVAGEVVQPIGPLSHPQPGEPLALAEAGSYDAVVLFEERARGAVAGFALTEDNVEAVGEIAATLGGVPLALELAAARVLVLSPQGIAERLQDRYRLLTKGARGAPPAQQSLRASVDASHELCEPGEQTLWARLSVFAGSFDLEAAEAVCSGHGIDEWEVLDLVDSLLERSVLVRDEDDGSTVRYRMLETIRAYGEQRLDPEERERWERRHLEWYAALAARSCAEWFGGRQPTWCRRLRRETANLQAALERATRSAGTAGVALQLVCDLEPFWVVTGRVGEGRRWIERAVAAHTDVGVAPLLEARALGVGAELAVIGGDLARVRAAVEAADRLVAAHGLDDVPVVTAVQRSKGTLLCWDGQPGEGRRLLEDAVARSASADDGYGEALGRLALGMCLLLTGDAAASDAALRAAVRLGETVGDLHVRSYALGMLGLSAAAAGDWDRAEEAARDTLGMRAALGDDFGVAFALEVLACAAAHRGQGERAGVLFGAAEMWRRAVGIAAQAAPGLQEVRRRGWEHARDSLGPRRFDAAVRRGRELEREQSIRLARDGELAEPATPAADRNTADDVPLTPREVEVARLVGQGKSNREIAEALVISHRTAQGHVEHILRKLGFGSRAQVAAWVAERQARSMLR